MKKIMILVVLIVAGLTLFSISDTKAVGVLEVKKTPDKVSVGAGETVTYTILITNTGDEQVTNVVVTDSLSADMVFLSSSPGFSSQSNGQIKWELGTLEPMSSKVIVLTVRVDSQLSGKVIDLNGDRLLVNGVVVEADGNAAAGGQSTIAGHYIMAGDATGGPVNGENLPITGINPLLFLLLALVPISGYVGTRLWQRR